MRPARRCWPAVLLAALGGCSSGSKVDSAAAAPPVPPDFQLNVAVWRAERRIFREVPETVEGEVLPGRYIVLVGGALHWSPEGDPSRGLPPRRRVLSMQEVDELWQLLLELGMGDPARGEPPINPRRARPMGEELTTIAIITGDDRSWMFQGLADDPELAALTTRLARLAWAADRGPAGLQPRRYDFGPDPYERYRR